MTCPRRTPAVVRLAFVAAAALALCGGGAVGCRAPTGPGLHVTVRAEPKKGYRQPSISPTGEVFAYGATVEPSPGNDPPAQPEPGFELIDYRRLGGIIVWVEPVGASQGAGPPPPPLNAAVDLQTSDRQDVQDVHLASVGGRVSFNTVRGGPTTFLVRGEDGEVRELSGGAPAFVPRGAGLLEVLSADDEDTDEPFARVFVAPTSRARKVRTGERVTFAPLPPGTYRVTTWHPILPGRSEVVEVPAGPLVKRTITVGVNALPKAAGAAR